MQSQHQHHTSTKRRRFFKFVFLMLCATLTQGLWRGLIVLPSPKDLVKQTPEQPTEQLAEPNADQPTEQPPRKPNLELDIEFIALNQNARMTIGLESLINKGGPSLAPYKRYIKQTARGGEQTVLTDRGEWMQLILYKHLGMTDDAEAKAKQLGFSPENSPPKPELLENIEPVAEPTDEPTSIQTSEPGTEQPLLIRRISAESDAALRAVFFDGAALEPGQAESLSAELGFTGQLIPTRLPVGDSERTPLDPAVASEALRFIFTFVIMGFVGISLFILGIFLLLAFTIASRSGRITWHFRPEAFAPYALFEAFTIFLAAFLLMGLAGQIILLKTSLDSMAWGIASEILLFGVVAYPLLCGMTWRETKDAFGLNTGRGVFSEALIGFAGYAAGLPILAVGILGATVVAKFMKTDVTSASHPIIPKLLSDETSIGVVIAILFLGVILAPLLEEIMFRGAFYRVLRSYFGIAPSVLLSGFFFAAIHPQGWIGVPLLMAVGIVLALLREWRSSIIAPFVTHACVNGATFAITILQLS